MRKIAVILAGWAIACGGQVAPPSPEAAGERTESQAPAAPPAETTTPSPAEDPGPPPPPKKSEPVVTTASRDGAPLYLSMCHQPLKPGVETIYGEITDHTFTVDEGIISFDLTLPTSTGPKKCASNAKAGVVVVFAESRGAEFTAEPSRCKFVLTDDGGLDDVIRGSVDAEYIGLADEPHHFHVTFAAPPCQK